MLVSESVRVGANGSEKLREVCDTVRVGIRTKWYVAVLGASRDVVSVTDREDRVRAGGWVSVMAIDDERVGTGVVDTEALFGLLDLVGRRGAVADCVSETVDRVPGTGSESDSVSDCDDRVAGIRLDNALVADSVDRVGAMARVALSDADSDDVLVTGSAAESVAVETTDAVSDSVLERATVSVDRVANSGSELVVVRDCDDRVG